MLVQLHIENYALIDHVVVEFGPGLNILTGETGAGKSLIIGALGLALGQRASTDVVREDDKPTVVEALFDIAAAPRLPPLLESLGIPLDESTLLLKRMVTRHGSRCYINAHLATVAMLQQTGQHLVDILGQHQQHTLLHPEQQLALLDSFGQLTAEREAFRQVFQRYHDLRQEYRRVRRDEQQHQQRQSVVQAQLQEIERAALQADEEERLSQEHHLLRHAERLHALAQEMYATLYREESSVLARLATTLHTLTQLEALDARQAHLHQDLQEGYYLIENVAQSLRDYNEHLEVNPARLHAIDERLAEIARLQRKYGTTIAAILHYRDELQREQQTWEDQGEHLKTLTAALSAVRQSALTQALKLSRQRQDAAGRLQQAVQRELKALNMANTVFEVAHAIRTHPQGDFTVGTERVALAPEGIDEVEYCFSPNPGEPPRSLARIASGGELSRVMLALKSILARADATPTLIFDEVDAGIGGRTARIVGEKLFRVAQSHQVFCITHLPQIASHGDHHYRIAKSVHANRTTTQIQPLDFTARIEELARMSGGKTITDTTRRHAEEMLTRRP